MKLIEKHHESIEGNQAINEINITLLENEIKDLDRIIMDCRERLCMNEAEEFEEELEVCLDQLEELSPNHKLLTL